MTVEAVPERGVPAPMRVLAELVVIVVGVLIALWVDNLNTERQDRRQEQAYLAGIVEDLRGDSSALVDRRTAAVRSLEVADRLIELRFDPPSPVPADSLAEWFFRAAFVDNFQVLDHTYREVLGAGGLTLISDDAVRRGISSYYRDIDSAEFFTEYYKGEESDYWDLLAERLDAADFAALTRSDRRGSLDVRRMLTLLREDDEIVNAVQMNRHWAELRLEITNRRIASNSSLIEVLRARLLDLG